ncbi:MAG TPA: hypothetical protein VE870_16965 [Bacteroidales bacterium]|nr:hypothetical protein [Bacteroidales bacterium]
MNRKRSLATTSQFIIENIFFLVLLTFSLVFAKERIINSDAGFYFFKLVNFGHFNIEHGRYSAFISQIALLAGVKIGLSLKTLLYLYSASFIVLFWLVYILVRNGLKNKGAALAILMTIAVGATHSNYRPVSESTQGLVYALVFFAILFAPFKQVSESRRMVLRTLLSLITIVLCYFAHPLTIFPVLFIIGFYTIERRAWKSYLPWILLLFTLVLYAFKFLVTKDSSYEGGKLSGLDIITQNLPRFFSIYSTKYLVKRLLNVYLVSTILFLALNIYYLWKKDYLKWIFTNTFILGFVLIYNLDYYAGGSDIEMDKNLMTMNLLIFLPFATDIYYNENIREWLRPVFMILVLGFSVITLLHPRKIYRQRISYYEELNDALQAQTGHKFYTEEENISKKVLFLWGVPFESLIISSLDGPVHSRTIYPVKNLNDLPGYIGDPDLFLCTFFWPKWNIDELNPHYFRLPEKPYHYLPAEDLPKTGNK